MLGLLQNVLLDSAGTDQPVDANVPGLSDAVAAVLRLCVDGGVPVTVIEHDRVRAREINAQTAAARREDEAEYAGVAVELLHHSLPTLHLRD